MNEYISICNQVNTMNNLSETDNYTTVFSTYSNRFGITITIKLFSNNDLQLAVLSFNIHRTEVELTFFESQQEDKGYGKEILCCFKKFIEQFEALTNIKIDRIYGQLSYKDYKNWEKLIYLYFSIYSVKPMIIDHKHTPLEFIKTMNSYSDKVVDFEIIL